MNQTHDFLEENLLQPSPSENTRANNRYPKYKEVSGPVYADGEIGSSTKKKGCSQSEGGNHVNENGA